jgi:hypothetical protein
LRRKGRSRRRVANLGLHFEGVSTSVGKEWRRKGRKGRVIGAGDYLDDGLFVPHSSSVGNREDMAEQV